MDMASRVLERRRVVQQLRKIAADAGADQCRDDASRKRVQDMMGAIRGADCPPGRLEEAEGIFKKFEATFAVTQSGAPDEARAPDDEAPAGREKFRMRGASFLLTYNWRFYEKPLPDGTPTPETEDDLWRLWKQWKAAAKKALGVTQSSSTMEQSLKLSLIHI